MEPPRYVEVHLRGCAACPPLLCFAHDLFGVQHAITADGRVVTADPETARVTSIGRSLHDWAEWLLADPDQHGTYGFATWWQDHHGPLDHHHRVIPWTLFVMGGGYTEANLVAKPSVECMRIRGPIAQHVQQHPGRVTLRVGW